MKQKINCKKISMYNPDNCKLNFTKFVKIIQKMSIIEVNEMILRRKFYEKDIRT